MIYLSVVDDDSWWRIIYLIVLISPVLYIVLVLLLLAFFALIGGLARAIEERRLLRRMKRAGRYLNRSELKETVLKSGTLLLEYPYLGWAASRLWWTPEKLEALVWMKPSTDDRVEALEGGAVCLWDGWAFRRWLAEDFGTAKLCRVWSGEKLKEQLLERDSSLACETVFTHFTSPGYNESDVQTP